MSYSSTFCFVLKIVAGILWWNDASLNGLLLSESYSVQFTHSHLCVYMLVCVCVLLFVHTKGGRGFLMSPPCLESQGCQFDPTFL